MMSSAERAYSFIKFICADKKRAKELLSINPEDAAKQINEYGYDYIASEIREYGKTIRPHLGGHACVDEIDETTGGMGVAYDEVEIVIQNILRSIIK